MVRPKLIAALVLCVVLLCAPALSVKGRAQQDKAESGNKDAESRALLEQTRRNLLAGLNELPNFVVEQVVNRYVHVQFEQKWRFRDKLELEVTFQPGKGEQFNLLRVNDQPATQSYETMGGSTSVGDFGTVLTAIFLPRAKAHFEKAYRETYHKRPTAVYKFSVLKTNSDASVSDKTSGQSIVSGYSGRMWIDTEKKGVLRLELNYDDLPADFPVSLSRRVIEYDWVTIGDQRYLLPVNSEVVMGNDRERYYTRNVIQFSNYHKFESKMKVLDQ